MKKKVLVIDDSKTFCAYIAKIIEDIGCEVFMASNGEEAMSLLPEINPDLITVDVEMPKMDGYEVCKRIRQSDQHFSNVPIIMVTGTDPVISRKKGFEVGAIDFISKPFNPDELSYAVDKVINSDCRLKNLNVLVAEDSKMIRVMCQQVLQELGVKTTIVNDGLEAFNYLKKNRGAIDLLLTANGMPHMKGLDLCAKVRQEKLMDEEAPIILMSTNSDHVRILEALNNGATDFLIKPFFREEFLARLKNHLEHRYLQLEREHKYDDMEKKFSNQRAEVIQTRRAAIEMMGAMAECRDTDTGFHIRRTRGYMELMAKTLVDSSKYSGKLDLGWVEHVIEGAPLHDIGKIGVPDRILLKPGRLTGEEFEEMKQHAAYGCVALCTAQKTLGISSFFDEAINIAGGHHEKWDGSGYPEGIEGEEIPLSARMMAIADVYDALVSKRVYKDEMSHEKACEIILDGKGAHFDPYLIDIFVDLADEFQAICLEYADSTTKCIIGEDLKEQNAAEVSPFSVSTHQRSRNGSHTAYPRATL